MSLNTLLEIIGTVTGLLCVWLTARQRLLCWPVGLVSVVAFGLLFFRIKLYADLGLQGFFFATGLYGWWAWAHGGARGGPLVVRRLTRRQWTAGAVVLPVVTLAVGWGLHRFTDASLPYWDTAAAVLSIGAQCLLMRKIYETWFLWIAVDVLSVGIYAVKQVWITAGLYAVFLGLACWGWRAWRKALEGRRQEEAPA